jgi:hypothetical protein
MIVYEGTEEWLDKVLKQSFLKLGAEYKFAGGTIRVVNELRSAAKDETILLDSPAAQEAAHVNTR